MVRRFSGVQHIGGCERSSESGGRCAELPPVSRQLISASLSAACVPVQPSSRSTQRCTHHCAKLRGRMGTSTMIGYAILLTICLLSTGSHGNGTYRSVAGAQEYCHLETFIATCEEDQVILMKSAYYGRMRLGRCVKGDLGYIGCSNDVLDIADMKCSGRHRCEIHIPDEQFEKTKPCYEELKSYFEASYRCVKVEKLDVSLCQSCDSVKLMQQRGYIASVVTQDTGCGAASCPWIIEGKPGDAGASTTYSSVCTQVIEYIFIKETVRTKSVSVCGGSKRNKHIYLSMGHAVEVTVATDLHRENKGYFLLSYEIIGCPDLEVDDDMWFRREANGKDGVVGCTSSDRKWHVTCMQPKWIGDIGNCTKHGKAESKPMAIAGIPLGYGTAIIIIVFVAVAVGILILGIGLLGWRWKKEERSRRRGRHRNTGKSHEPMKSTFEIEPVDNFENCMKHHHSCTLEPYTHVWELPGAQRHDVTVLPDDMHRASLVATYGTTECVNKRVALGHLCSNLDRCSITYTRPDALDPVSEESPRYFDIEPQ